MKPLFKPVLPVLVLFLLITGCKKDKEETKSRKDLLTSGPWKQTAATSVRQSDGTSTDIYTAQLPCRKDDEFGFSAANVFSQTEGATKCSAGDPQVQFTGTWAFVNDETAIKIAAAGAGGLTARILELTATSMKLENTQNGYIMTVSYRH